MAPPAQPPANSVVSKGDKILISDFGTTESTIVWKQNLQDKTAVFISCNFEIILKDSTKQAPAGDDEKGGKCFIEKSKLAELKQKKLANEKDFTFIVTSDFQYGQRKGGTKRWLVFHDKSQRMFQHRFIQATWLALGNKAVDVASDLIYAGTPKIDGAMIEVLGEPLRDF